MDIKRISFALVVGLLPIFTLFISSAAVIIIDKKKFKTFKSEFVKSIFDWKELLLFSTFIIFVYYFIYPIIAVDQKVTTLSYVISIVIIFIFVGYGAVIQPFIFLIRSKQYYRDIQLENWVREVAGQRIKIRIIDKNLLNAFATGLLPFSQLILVGKPILEKLDKTELNCLLYHEIGHLKLNHIVYLTIIIFLVQVVGMIIYVQTLSALNLTMSYAWIIKGSILGSLFILFQEVGGLYQKRMEYEADTFAAKQVGKEAYISFLLRLDQLTEGMLSRKTTTHPILSDRIKNVEKA